MSALFRLSTTRRRDAAVESWLLGRRAGLREIAQHWFGCMRGCGENVWEALHDGCATACIGDAAFAYVGVYKNHVGVGFFRGAELSDPSGLLQGTGKLMSLVKITEAGQIDDRALLKLIEEAYRDMVSKTEKSVA